MTHKAVPFHNLPITVLGEIFGLKLLPGHTVRIQLSAGGLMDLPVGEPIPNAKQTNTYALRDMPALTATNLLPEYYDLIGYTPVRIVHCEGKKVKVECEKLATQASVPVVQQEQLIVAQAS
jgi:hypothetical protein